MSAYRAPYILRVSGCALQLLYWDVFVRTAAADPRMSRRPLEQNSSGNMASSEDWGEGQWACSKQYSQPKPTRG